MILKKAKNRILKGPLPFKYLIPNILTITGLAIGATSIRFAIESRWEMAVGCVIIAAIVDGIDGRVARFLNATSIFGAELDSLCDFINFGFCPALLIYLWNLNNTPYRVILWAAVLIFIICGALRLARFNTHIYAPNPNYNNISKLFFIGVPIPVGAVLALIPIMLDFEDLSYIIGFSFKTHYVITVTYIVVIGFMMASRLPTISLKNLIIHPEYIWLCLLFLAILTILTITYPWYLIPLIGFIYSLSIPLTVIAARRIN